MKTRFVVTAVLAITLAALPIRGDARSSVRLGIATASCDEGPCGDASKMDCFCPDWQELNRKPRCVEQPGREIWR